MHSLANDLLIRSRIYTYTLKSVSVHQRDQCRKGKNIQCESHQQCTDILKRVAECKIGRCIVPSCKIDEHCPPDHKCLDQICIILEKCSKHNDCGPGFDCVDGFCTTEEWGTGECTEDEDCPDEVYFFFKFLIAEKLYILGTYF